MKVISSRSTRIRMWQLSTKKLTKSYSIDPPRLKYHKHRRCVRWIYLHIESIMVFWRSSPIVFRLSSGSNSIGWCNRSFRWFLSSLSNHLYVPYIRFSFALTVLDQHQSNRISPILDMVKNLPILEMTSTETVYYERLIHALSTTVDLMPEQHRNWSSKLLSVALLDCLLGILDCSTSFFQSTQFNVQRWQEVLEAMRQEVKSRWTIEEKTVLAHADK